MEEFRVDLKTFWVWLSLTNTPKVSESKYQAGFRVIISGQNLQTLHDPYICMCRLPPLFLNFLFIWSVFPVLSLYLYII